MAVYRGSVSEQRATVSDAAISSLLGAAIREARQSRKLSMRALAASANVSQPFLSTVESGQTMPSLASLYRIAAALEVSPSHLLPAAGEPEPITVSRRDASGWAPITDHPDTGFHRVVSSGTARRATVQEYVLEPGQRLGDWYQSDGELTVYVAEGSITVEVEGSEHLLAMSTSHLVTDRLVNLRAGPVAFRQEGFKSHRSRRNSLA